jgi:hypothetical protein
MRLSVKGFTTFSIMTFIIMTLSYCTLRTIALSIPALRHSFSLSHMTAYCMTTLSVL